MPCFVPVCRILQSALLLLSCDVYPYSIGVVLSHQWCWRWVGGTEKTFGFASRTLSVAESKYSHLDNEGLVGMFGVRSFHQYLCGRSFMVVMDHKPLTALFKADKAIPQMCSPRVQHWALTLAHGMI